MNKLFIFLILCPFYFFSQNFQRDSLYVGTSLKILNQSLVHEEYSTSSCYTRGNYIPGINESDLLCISGILKCEERNSDDKYFLVVNFSDKTGYVEAAKDKTVLFNKKRITVSEFYSIYQKMNLEEKEDLKNNSLKMSMNNTENKKVKLFDYLNQYDKYGIAIIKANAYDNYSMTGASFKIMNTSKKIIKYITFTFYGLNAVDDKVGSNKIKKGIGPVERYEKGAWEFDAVWLTDIVEYIKIINIQIQYMDGKIKTIPYSKELWIDEDKLYELESIL